MNLRQQVFWTQAKSDWDILELVRREKKRPCHELHYLQMCTEKLAKAYFTKAPSKHDALVAFIRAMNLNKKAIAHLGFADDAELDNWAKSVSPLAHAIEGLAPDLAKKTFGIDINPEYPWPKGNEAYAPHDYDFKTEVFDLVETQEKSGQQHFLVILEKMVNTLDQWCE